MEEERMLPRNNEPLDQDKNQSSGADASASLSKKIASGAGNLFAKGVIKAVKVTAKAATPYLKQAASTSLRQAADALDPKTASSSEGQDEKKMVSNRPGNRF